MFLKTGKGGFQEAGKRGREQKKAWRQETQGPFL